MNQSHDLPPFWLTAFWGFAPEEEAVWGFTKEVDRQRFLDVDARPGHLVAVYGANSGETAKKDRRQLFGVLQINPIPIKDWEKQSQASYQHKRERGHGDKWTFALPVRRAWRSLRPVDVKHLLQTYREHPGQFTAAYGRELYDDDKIELLKVPVREVPVFGEPPLPSGWDQHEGMLAQFSPSTGIPKTFGTSSRTDTDGLHYIYVMRFTGAATALLERGLPARHGIFKFGYSNAPKRRLSEVNSGHPPAAKHRWKIWRTSEIGLSAAAESAEKHMRQRVVENSKFTSLGGEFFTAHENDALALFTSHAKASQWAVKVI